MSVDAWTCKAPFWGKQPAEEACAENLPNLPLHGCCSREEGGEGNVCVWMWEKWSWLSPKDREGTHVGCGCGKLSRLPPPGGIGRMCVCVCGKRSLDPPWEGRDGGVCGYVKSSRLPPRGGKRAHECGGGRMCTWNAFLLWWYAKGREGGAWILKRIRGSRHGGGGAHVYVERLLLMTVRQREGGGSVDIESVPASPHGLGGKVCMGWNA